MNKNRIIAFLIIASVMLAGCGKDADVESAETAVDTVEAVETEEEETEDEESEVSYYTGYNHYIDPEEMGKTAESETEIKEDGQEAAETEAAVPETTVPETTESIKEETKADSQTEDNTPASEAAPTSESVAEQVPSIPDKSQLKEWTPPINMLFVSDANIIDVNGNVLGFLPAGCDIGVSGECPGFYQVNYGAVRSFVVKTALAPNN